MFKTTYRPMRALLLAGVLSLAAASAVQAGGHSTSGDFHSGASTAPACEGTGRSQKKAEAGQLSRDWCRVLASGNPSGDTDQSAAGDGGPSGPGDDNGRTAALVIDPHWMMAGGRGGMSGDV